MKGGVLVKSERLEIRLTTEQKEFLRKEAERLGITMVGVIEQMIDERKEDGKVD